MGAGWRSLFRIDRYTLKFLLSAILVATLILVILVYGYSYIFRGFFGYSAVAVLTYEQCRNRLFTAILSLLFSLLLQILITLLFNGSFPTLHRYAGRARLIQVLAIGHTAAFFQLAAEGPLRLDPLLGAPIELIPFLMSGPFYEHIFTYLFNFLTNGLSLTPNKAYALSLLIYFQLVLNIHTHCVTPRRFNVLHFNAFLNIFLTLIYLMSMALSAGLLYGIGTPLTIVIFYILVLRTAFRYGYFR